MVVDDLRATDDGVSSRQWLSADYSMHNKYMPHLVGRLVSVAGHRQMLLLLTAQSSDMAVCAVEAVMTDVHG